MKETGGMGFWALKANRLYSVSYEKSINGGEYKKYWMNAWVDSNGYINFKIYNSQDAFDRSPASARSGYRTILSCGV